jgi:hypothetical protein
MKISRHVYYLLIRATGWWKVVASLNASGFITIVARALSRGDVGVMIGKMLV